MPADTINRLLTSLAVRAHAFALCEIKSGHRLAFDSVTSVTIHYVLAGYGTIQTAGRADTSYEPYCMIVVPARTAHSLGEAEASAKISTSTAACGLLINGLVRFTAGDGSQDTLVVCATITASYGGALGMFDGLSAPVVHQAGDDESLGGVFPALTREVAAPGLGTQALIEALMKQALILLLRHHLLSLNAESPLFATLHDGRLARVVAAVIELPATGWTVDSLASIAGMSRSAFAEHFARVFDQTPMEFVQIVRLRLGADLLRATDLPIPVVAASAGFRSRTYFDRTFKAVHGMTPCAYRSRTREGEAVAHDARGPAPVASGLRVVEPASSPFQIKPRRKPTPFGGG